MSNNSLNNFVTVNLPRSGLGHSLESYSRAFCVYASGKADFIHPTWYKIRIGPYLRNEIDKRDYWKYIKTPKDWGLHPINNWRKFYCQVVNEKDFNPSLRNQYLIVKDEGVHSFIPIEEHKTKFIESLESISRYPIRNLYSQKSIGIFHRSGDFKNLKPQDLNNEFLNRTHGYGYLPPEYSSEALRKCREIAGWQVPAFLSTDAKYDEIKCILNEGNVHLVKSKSSFSNLLEMRFHDILILGTSSYGRWSYFLGDSFGIFPKTRDIQDDFIPLGLKNRDGAWFVFDDCTSLNEEKIRNRLRSKIN
jgi:hypothetical protein